MRIQANAFPVIYLNAVCTRHDCVVTISPAGTTNPRTKTITGVQIAALACERGGIPDDRREGCEDSWRMNITTPGGIAIPQQ